MRKLASIQKVLDIRPIENADRIEEAIIEGWHVVVLKNEFHVGNLVVYCEIDSILPKENPSFAFLEGKHIKTKKLRGIYSQGIAFPLTVLPNNADGHLSVNYHEGQDVTEELGVTKWEPDIWNKVNSHYDALNTRPFPSGISKSDEQRVQTLQKFITRYKGTHCVVTEKLDGSSTTLFLDEDKNLHVCSRNLEIIDENDNRVRVAREEGFKENLLKLPEDTVLQGELVGPHYQGNKYKLTKDTLFIFNMSIKGQFIDNEIEGYTMLENAGIKHVPIVNKDFILNDNIDELVKYAEAKSVLNNKVEREGIVIRPIHRIEVRDDLDDYFVRNRFSFKVINPRFLIKNNL